MTLRQLQALCEGAEYPETRISSGFPDLGQYGVEAENGARACGIEAGKTVLEFRGNCTG
jgi:hypothetical protein